MKISVAALTRFHMFEQAQQLYLHGYLEELITGYPYGRMNHWPDLQKNAKTYPYFGLWQQAAVKLSAHGLDKYTHGMRQSIACQFSKKVSRSLSPNSDIIIGLSSFSLEMIRYAHASSRLAIVDHGSIHEKTEGRILESECKKYGFSKFGNWQHNWLVKRMDHEFNQADFVFCCSKLARDTFVENGVSKDKIFVNPLGVDLARFNTDKPCKLVVRPKRVLFVGGINPRKGIHYLVNAFISAGMKNTELWLVGGSATDPALKQILLDATKINKNIFLKGVFAENELREVYQQCDILVLPSLSDGWGMVVLQAMACGLPVIVTDMTGAKEVVESGVNGWIIPSRDSTILAEQLMFALSDLDRLKKMGAEAKKSVQQGYTWNDYGDRLNRWLEMCPYKIQKDHLK